MDVPELLEAASTAGSSDAVALTANAAAHQSSLPNLAASGKTWVLMRPDSQPTRNSTAPTGWAS